MPFSANWHGAIKFQLMTDTSKYVLKALAKLQAGLFFKVIFCDNPAKISTFVTYLSTLVLINKYCLTIKPLTNKGVH